MKKDSFEHSALVPTVIAENILTKNRIILSDKDKNWFFDHVEARMRYLWSNVPRYQKKMASSRGLSWSYAFVEHWLKAFLKDKEEYKIKYSESVWSALEKIRLLSGENVS